MTITYKGIVPTSRSAKNVKGVRTYSEVHQFVTTERYNDADGQWIIGSHEALPQIGDLRSQHFGGVTDPEAWCDSITPKCGNGYTGWDVTVTWTTENISRDADNTPQAKTNPLSEPALFDWDGEQYQRPAIIDTSGNLIGNAAGDPYDPPEMIDDSRLVCRVEKNVAAVPGWLLAFRDAVNSGPFALDGLGVAAGQAKFQRLSLSRQQVRNGVRYRVLKFEIHLRAEGWRLRPINAGFRDANGEAIVLPDGTYPTAPVPLLPDGSGPLDPPTLAGTNFGDHAVYRTADFNQLPLS